MKKTKNKALIWVLSVAVVLLAIAGVVASFMLNYNQHFPSEVEILEDGGNVYISTSANDNYLLYRFKFIDGENEIIIDSNKNILSLEELQEEGIEIGKTYQVSTCYLSENEGNNSLYSKPIEWKVTSYLKAPVLTQVDNYLFWDEVANAESYKLYINNDFVSTTTASYDISQLNGGEYEFYVVACSSNQNYKDSYKSNVINVPIVHHYDSFSEISFNQTTKMLTIKGNEELTEINVYINEKAYETTMFETIFDEETQEYIITLDITTIYEKDAIIGASPKTIDEYHVFDGEIIIVQ